MKFRRMILGFALASVTWTRGEFTPSHPWRVFTQADGLAENHCLSVTPGAGGNILVRHAQSPLISIFNGYSTTLVSGPDGEPRRVYESPGGQLWCVSPEGLLELRETDWITHPVAEVALHFRARATNPVPLLPVRQGRVLVLLPELLLQAELEAGERARSEVLLRAEQTARGRFTAFAAGRDGGLWLAAERGFVKIAGPVRNLKPDVAWTVVDEAPVELTPPPGTSPAQLPVEEVLDQTLEFRGAVWLATPRGLFRSAAPLWRATADGPPLELPARVAPPPLPEEIAGPVVWKIFHRARNGDWWLGTDQAVAWRHREEWRLFVSTNQLGPEHVQAFAESPEGRMWCATPEKVWEFDGQGWLGLRGGFTNIHTLLGARNGTLWVAADDGLHRYTRGAWIANGPEDGLLSPVVIRLVEDAEGRLLAETSAGWCEFQPEADREPPRSFIEATGGGEVYREDDMITLRFRGRDRWHHTAPGRLLFSHRLDEREWTPFQEEREVSFASLPVGKHYFQLRAMDRNGNIEPRPAPLEFVIAAPWYRDLRLVWILAIALAVAIFFAGLAFNRHRQLQRSYADVERQVAERTRELEQAHRELLHSQKMNALGTLAAGIAHDFNNILSIVKGSAQIIEDNLDNPAKVRTRLDRIKTVVQQGAGIVEAMLGFGRASGPAVERCDANAVVEDTVTLLGDRFLREIEVRFERTDGLPELAAPREFVQQVLLNFILNAREAMERRSADRLDAAATSSPRADVVTGAPPRKRITLATTFCSGLPAGMVLTPAAAATYVGIAVRDNGCGIPAEILPRIFEPFFTTKSFSARRGTGLGLSMVYELAKKMSAGLAVETTVGAGSTFTLFVPVQDEPVPAGPREESRP